MKIITIIFVFFLFLSQTIIKAEDIISPEQITTAFKSAKAGVHPRIFADKEKFEDIKKRINIDPIFKNWFDQYQAFGDAMFADSDFMYVTEDVEKHGPKNFLNSVSRPFANHMQTWAFLYQITGDNKYLDRVRRDLTTVLAFKDMGVKQSILNVGEMSYGYAIAYDWLYDVLTISERKAIIEKIENNAFNPVEETLRKKTGFALALGNVSDVVSGGVSMAALAIMDESPNSARVISGLLVTYKKRLEDGYQPDGVGSEGPMYWQYAVKYGVRFLAALNSVLNTDFDYSENQGLKKTGNYAIYFTGPSGSSFNFSDAGEGGMHAQELLWLSSRYRIPEYGWQTLNKLSDKTKVRAVEVKQEGKNKNKNNDEIEKIDFVRDPFRFLWAEPENYKAPTEKNYPLVRMFKGPCSLATFRSAWNDPNALYFSLKGGENMLKHGDLDIGDFVLDAAGVQWAVNLGHNNYNSPGFFNFDGPRWIYYRKRAEGQNTFVINPGMDGGQVKANSTFEKFSDTQGNSFAILNMTAAYPDANNVKRGVKFDSKTALLQDEIETKSLVDIYWFMHTKAKITIENNGKTAHLQQDGKTLFAECISPEGAKFTVMDAVPLPSSPNPSENDSNKGIQKLTISLSKVSNVTISVAFTTEKDKSTLITKTLSEWK